MLTEVLRLLPQLSQAELKKVQVHITALTSTTELNGESDSIYFAFTEAKKRQGETPPPLYALKRTRGYKRFAKGAEAVDLFIEKLSLRKIDRFRLGTFLGNLCIEFLKERETSLDLYSYSWSLTLVEEIVNRSFPGYASAGMLGAIVDGKLNESHKRRTS